MDRPHKPPRLKSFDHQFFFVLGILPPCKQVTRYHTNGIYAIPQKSMDKSYPTHVIYVSGMTSMVNLFSKSNFSTTPYNLRKDPKELVKELPTNWVGT
jgi:hypothetical protein